MGQKPESGRLAKGTNHPKQYQDGQIDGEQRKDHTAPIGEAQLVTPDWLVLGQG